MVAVLFDATEDPYRIASCESVCMPMQNGTTSVYCIFEYMYRDAGNWKTYGALLFCGDSDGMAESLRQHLECEELFVAEQIGIPSLCAEHFADCGDGPSDLDHAYHEFVDLRAATDSDVESMQVAGSLDELIKRIRAAAGKWDVRFSPNCYL